MTADARTTGTALIEALIANGVDTVFGIPGTHNIEIYRGIQRSQGRLRHVLPRHEQGAAYAADGYARATGRAGVVVTTSGPGLTNAITGIANAYADSVPMLVITPGIPRGHERRDIGWLHEVKDQRSAMDDIADRSVRPGSPRAAVDAVHEAFARWCIERPRPVHIEVPLDVLEAHWSAEDGDPAVLWTPPLPPAPAADTIAEVARLVAEADGPVVIVAGGGAVDSASALTALAEKIDAAVVTTTLGKGCLDERHPLAVGEFAVYDAVAPLLRQAGLIIAVGTELGNPGLYEAVTAPLVRVDISAAQVHKNVRAGVAVLSDATLFCEALVAAVAERSDAAVREVVASTRRSVLDDVAPVTAAWEQIQSVLQAALPGEVIITGDSSQVSYLGTGPYWQFAQSRHYIVTTGYSTLGYSLPAAIGAKLARPETPVVSIVGDGAFLFSLQELITLAQLNLSLPVLVVDNGGFAEIRQNMIDAGMPPVAVEPGGMDLALFAASVGVAYVRVDTPEHLGSAAREALAAAGPTLVHYVLPSVGRPLIESRISDER
ncbi:thiamine pyrophosphate-binding protein [Microbacterium tumbae]